MIKMTQQQMTVLASAATQPDGFARRPAHLKPAAAAKLAGKLIEHGLVREQRAKGDAPVWREDTDGQRFSLKLLKAGRALVAAPAIQVATGPSDATSDQPPSGTEPAASPSDLEAASNTSKSRCPTKRSLILDLIRRDGGATLDDLIAATDWLPHTTRAALTGLRKSGFAIERSRDEGGTSVYRIAPAAAAAAA